MHQHLTVAKDSMNHMFFRIKWNKKLFQMQNANHTFNEKGRRECVRIIQCLERPQASN